MSKPIPLNADELELERGLRSLRPLGLTVSESEIWYRAGLRVGGRRTRYWQGLTAIAAVSFAVWIAFPVSPVPRPANPTAQVSEPPVRSIQPLAADYLLLREAVQRNGWNAVASEQPVEARSSETEHDAPRAVPEDVLRPIDHNPV